MNLRLLRHLKACLEIYPTFTPGPLEMLQLSVSRVWKHTLTRVAAQAHTLYRLFSPLLEVYRACPDTRWFFLAKIFVALDGRTRSAISVSLEVLPIPLPSLNSEYSIFSAWH